MKKFKELFEASKLGKSEELHDVAHGHGWETYDTGSGVSVLGHDSHPGHNLVFDHDSGGWEHTVQVGDNMYGDTVESGSGHGSLDKHLKDFHG